MESFFRSIGDLRDTDLRQRLAELDLETLGIYGIHDNIVSPTNAAMISNGVKVAQVMMMEKSRHFPMIDEPTKFTQTLNEFLNNGNDIERRL